MQLGNISGKAAAAAVWSATTRSITSLGTAIAIGSAVQVNVPAGATAAITPAASTVAIISAGVHPGVGGQCKVSLYDGTDEMFVILAGAGSPQATPATIINNTVNMLIHNLDGGNAAKYSYAFVVLK